MKCQTCFLGKNKKYIFKISSAENFTQSGKRSRTFMHNTILSGNIQLYLRKYLACWVKYQQTTV